jgi:hypothetical protein
VDLWPDHELGVGLKTKENMYIKTKQQALRFYTIRLKLIFPHKKGRSIDLPFLLKASI